MSLLQILLLGIVFFVLPYFAGRTLSLFGKFEKDMVFDWIFGQIFLWAIFLVICVPLVLLGKSFEIVVWIFGSLMLILALCGVLSCFWKKGKKNENGKANVNEKGNGKLVALMTIFGFLLLFQLFQAVRLTYADWDDAYYVATSTVTLDANSMYRKLAYSGGETTLDLRHGLAPFPIWIAFLAKISGVAAVTTAHVAVPICLIPMTYGIFYLIGKKLFAGDREKIALFLIMTELLVLFGNYSIYSVENFMLARSRQGKAALGSIMIPAMIYLMILLLEYVHDKCKIPIGYWFVLECAVLATCLCSTMGALLGCMLIGLIAFLSGIFYRRWKLLIPAFVCCMPALFLMVLYGVMK